MPQLAATYKFIADILSFEDNILELEHTLTKPNFNWDNIVKEGSKHLVLPAIFCRLNAKKLLHVLPEELHIYLEEITNLNRQRNASILKQVHVLSELFNKHHINHVFLKGAALLASGIYEDNAERMIGDIDILVHLDQIDMAYDLLKANHFEPIPQTFGNSFFEHKHLPRLTTKHYVAAVELHRKLFVNYTDEALENSKILHQKRIINKVAIPSQEHLLKHNILNFQINDNGRLYNSINFRSVYDTLLIRERYNDKLAANTDKIFRKYYIIAGLFFKELQTDKGSKTLQASFYRFKLEHPKFYKVWNKGLNYITIFNIICQRIPLFIINKAYRRQLIDDRKRVFRYLKSLIKSS